ncbi:unnamed protein product (macronuclear) [Paramecium tetraurelia]|uniref:Guanylate cyclase domain-containing protein n=1 Tax=Paramecium tetraurelia TaxID=5888 RepID=A0EGU8_PARTE|nr:uncharacterized protein GSPATT00026863001 [Paramecium tetraurelia]CAK94539.1 unnamed protein product [Paramecium tetraurelia]|eukprot:XP_001461912.1 hypothetical protein (macronuclear) [Paramecium tetraurelia strain d4-2]
MSEAQVNPEVDNQSVISEDSNNEDVDVFGQDQEIDKFPLLTSILDSSWSQILVNLLTIYALFGDDIRIIAFDKRADDGFDVITIICMIIFSIEIIIASLVRTDYFNSFFFWLDIISTVSQILDITSFNIAVGLQGSVAAKSASQLSQANKASKTSSKAIRVVRLVRLIRIVKLYKAASYSQEQAFKRQPIRTQTTKKSKATIYPSVYENINNGPVEQENLNKKENNTEQRGSIESHKLEGEDNANSQENRENQNMVAKQQQIDNSIPKVQQIRRQSMKEPSQVKAKEKKESRVSKRLSDSTTKKVIILVILLLLIMPLFSSDYYFEPSYSLAYAAEYVRVVAEIPNTKLTEINQTIYFVIDQHKSFDTPVGYITNPFTEIENYETPSYQYLRESSKSYYFELVDPVLVGLEYIGDPVILFVSDNSDVESKNSIINIVNTLFVSAVLLFGAIAFSNDANNVALKPIDRMIVKVNLIAKNPQLAKEMKLESDGTQKETTQIENAIIKIGALLALGFGDAGSAIIGTNMASSGDVDPMLPGKRKWAIYGFCDIRNFTDATEVLQKDVMLFVNNIAEIVHSMVDRYQGSANKNIGDAFLLVWKINDSQWYEDGNEIKWSNLTFINQLADCALIAFMKIYAKINREPKILEYRNDERLSQRLPGYKVKMGFGLHIGWGIEGAIGSEFKIDASYLSPNVNMASRLEAATKQYGVAVLISSELHQYFSNEVKKYTRQIDKVTVKGSVKPIGLFTVEMEADDLPPSKQDYPQEEKQQVMYEKKQIFLQQLESGDFNAELYIKRNKDLGLITKNVNQEFLHQFGQGFQGYLLGNWKEAHMLFEKAKQIRPNDGPISTLFNVMGETNFKAPSDWKGYRELTEK